MATIKQIRAFTELGVNGGNISKAMRVAGYSKESAKRTDKLTNKKGWKELVNKYLPDSVIAKRHRELLDKREIVIVHDGKQSRVELTDQPHSDVKQAIDMAYKVKSRYPREGTNTAIQINFGLDREEFNAIP